MYCNVYVINLPTDIRRYISKFLPNPVLISKKYRSDIITIRMKRNAQKYITWYEFCISNMASQLDMNDFCIARKAKLTEILNCPTYKEILSLINKEDQFYKRSICNKFISQIKYRDDIYYENEEDSETDDESSDEEDLPVTEETPFEFNRIRRRLEANLEYPRRESITYFDDSEDIVHYSIEICCNYSGMRKSINSSGDITYRRRSVCSPVDVFWYGIESGVCESCQHLSGRYHPIWYKISERNYQGTDYNENRILESIPNYTPSYYRVTLQCEIESLHSLRVLMRHKKLPLTLNEAIKRQQLHITIMEDIDDKNVAILTDILSTHGMEMPSSVKHMNKKMIVMQQLFCSCICRKNFRVARVWKIKAPLHIDEMIMITPLHISEEIIRNRVITIEGDIARNWLITSEVRKVEQPCACLCVCGHRNTNYTENCKPTSFSL